MLCSLPFMCMQNFWCRQNCLKLTSKSRNHTKSFTVNPIHGHKQKESYVSSPLHIIETFNSVTNNSHSLHQMKCPSNCQITTFKLCPHIMQLRSKKNYLKVSLICFFLISKTLKVYTEYIFKLIEITQIKNKSWKLK